MRINVYFKFKIAFIHNAKHCVFICLPFFVILGAENGPFNSGFCQRKVPTMFFFHPINAIVLLTLVIIHCQMVHMSGRCYNPSDKFFGCCQQIGMTSAMTNLQTLIRDACRYPPADLAVNQKMTLGSYFNEYVMCYADAKDNSQCCANAGVPARVTFGVWSVNCQDLCRGTGQRLTRNAAWDKCSPYRAQIADCNQRGVTLGTESAAVIHRFCRNPKWCQQPMGWQMACGHP